MLEALEQHYTGFWIEQPAGNNAFSHLARAERRIYVAELKAGSLGDLAPGSNTAFAEVENGIEIRRSGLKTFLYLHRRGRHFFIFDNHNHAFCFWLAAFQAGIFRAGRPLVHVDQHTDMREPETEPSFTLEDFTLRQVFDYTNFGLNVGNFVQPALKLGLFSGVEFVDSSTAFAQRFGEDFVLDIDIDIFADELSYIDHELKLQRIHEYIEKTQLITLATSPYFIDQGKALELVKTIVSPWTD